MEELDIALWGRLVLFLFVCFSHSQPKYLGQFPARRSGSGSGNSSVAVNIITCVIVVLCCVDSRNMQLNHFAVNTMGLNPRPA